MAGGSRLVMRLQQRAQPRAEEPSVSIMGLCLQGYGLIPLHQFCVDLVTQGRKRTLVGQPSETASSNGPWWGQGSRWMPWWVPALVFANTSLVNLGVTVVGRPSTARPHQTNHCFLHVDF